MDPGRKSISLGYHPSLRINSPITAAEIAPILQQSAESGQKQYVGTYFWRQQQARGDSSLPSSSAPVAVADSFPKSPCVFNPNDFMFSQVLPPLKFRYGLLTPHSLVSPCDDDEENDEDVESVASVPPEDDGIYSEEEVFGSNEDFLKKPIVQGFDEETVFNKRSFPNINANSASVRNHGYSLNRGPLKKNLMVELPGTFRRLADGEQGFGNTSQKTSSPGCARQLQKQAHVQSARGTQLRPSCLRDTSDLGTPSAPPISDVGGEENSGEVISENHFGSEDSREVEQTTDEICLPRPSDAFDGWKEGFTDWKSKSQTTTERGQRTIPGEQDAQDYQSQLNHPDRSYYSTSGQQAWQTLIAYDACIRLCLHAWERGSTESSEFLRDGCLVLRSAFGLHKFLLQTRHAQAAEQRTIRHAEEIASSNPKKVVGKIKVEVKKIRIIPRRKLKNTYSQRSAIYMQAGAEYIRHVSSLVKSGMNSLKLSPLSMTSEEQLSCLIQLKSATENTDLEPSSAICLHPGSGDCHVFYPETQGDALLVDVQDSKTSIQGRSTISISSLIDSVNDRLRWWPIYLDDQECVGKIQLSIGHTMTSEQSNNIKSGPVVETLAYDLLLEAAMRAQHFGSRNLSLHGSWKWLLTQFSEYYGVSSSYARLRYLSHVMNVATPTKDCLELINELLVPILEARSEKSLTRQERSILLDCDTQIENLLANVFENYKSLDENSITGLADLLCPTQESAAPALTPAVQIYTLLHDILSLDTQTMLKNYFQTAAKKRCRKHMIETDEFVSSTSEGFLMDSITISTTYLKMKHLCKNISDEIQADIKIHNQNVLPSSIDLSNITAAVYSTQLCNRLRAFLAAWPPSGPLPYVNELLIATADFERNLESCRISPVQGGVDSRNLFHNYIMVWVEDMQLSLLDQCKAEKVPWAGVTTNHSTSLFAEEMYEKIRESLIQYEVVINRWPQYSLILETATANVERAIVKALERQYNDILTPLKDSIPKRLNMQVQKLTRRQSTATYTAPNQLGTFLNTIKRILDVLHVRVDTILQSWSSCIPAMGEKKSLFGEQMNGITVLLRTKYKNYLQATVAKLSCNMHTNRSTRLKRILEETKEEDGEAEVRERMQILSSSLIDTISNLHEVFSSPIFVAMCRGVWDRMGQIVLKFLEGRKENRVWYNGSYYALGILDDTFASQMQRLLGNAVQEKDVEPPRSVVEARSILCRDNTNMADTSSYLYL